MSLIFKDSSFKNGVVVTTDAEGNEIQVDDVNVLTKSQGSGDGIVILNKGDNVFIPNDITDRQVIVDSVNTLADSVNTLADSVNTLADAVTEVNVAIPSMASSTTAPTKITQVQNTISNVESNINDLKTNLQQIKDKLK